MMTTSKLFAVLVAGAALLLLPAVPAVAQTPELPDRAISVSGEGTVRVVPDQAVVRFGIVTVSEDPEEARRGNAEAAREAMNAVRALGVPERKLRMEVLRLQPHRELDPAARRYVERGYEAVRQVVVELDDLEQLPALITEVVQKGANRLENVTYDLQDRDAVRNEALREAVVQAREKARLVAATLDETLGRVVRVDEQQFDFPRPMVAMDAAYARAEKQEAAPEPDAFAAGEIEVRVSVRAVFEVE